MGLSDGEMQSSLKQSPVPVLFGKHAAAVLNRTPKPLSDSSILFNSVTLRPKYTSFFTRTLAYVHSRTSSLAKFT